MQNPYREQKRIKCKSCGLEAAPFLFQMSKGILYCPKCQREHDYQP